MSPENRLKELGYETEPPPLGKGKIEPAVRSGNLVFTSGQVSELGDDLYRGKVGEDYSVEEGYQAARICGVRCLLAVKAAVSDLDKVVRVVKVLGMVNASEGFSDTPGVINGCTDLLVEVLGDAGRHARSAVGVYQLPRNCAVEIELIAEVKD